MKVAILTSALQGGAGIAAKRLYASLQLICPDMLESDLITIESLGGMLVGEDIVPSSGGSNKAFSDTHYTIEYPGYARSSLISVLSGYDIINIHWSSFLITTTEILRLQRIGIKILFTLHDFYYLYGGCHYPHTCDNWLNKCNRCPQLSTDSHPDYSPYINYLAKEKIRENSFVHFVAPSTYLIERLISDGQFHRSRTKVIRNPIDTQVFNLERRQSKEMQSNPPRILIIADSVLEKRKGFTFAYSALLKFSSIYTGIDFEVVIAGQGSSFYKDKLIDSGINATAVERINGEVRMSELYSSVDIVFSPSLEDNWPNILVEGFACGCLLLVGPGHGCEEFVNLYNAGVVSQSYSSEDFALSLYKLMTQAKSHHTPSPDVYNQFLSDHKPAIVAETYIELFNNLMAL
jgi:glycosyltransferase involved in cell wall biosynthesis